MNKNVIITLVIIVVLIIAAVLLLVFRNKGEENNLQNNSNNNSNQTVTENNNDNNDGSTGGKTLVVYYSATNNTKRVAEKIAEELDADIFEIEAKDEYTSADLNYSDSDSRVSREYADESLRDVELVSASVTDWDSYETVLVGYPIWWGIAAWPVDSFVKGNSFDGKTVVPFCTSSSSGLGRSGELLAETASSGNWLDGHRFSSNPSDSDIEDFVNSLN